MPPLEAESLQDSWGKAVSAAGPFLMERNASFSSDLGVNNSSPRYQRKRNSDTFINTKLKLWSTNYLQEID
ncbi:hypothetical protein DAI22_05g208250 [Oryza sativa Japonica Group]|nr:hypothetical protein DAI22_05g208250 [Oryza sativa Japonica Group]